MLRPTRLRHTAAIRSIAAIRGILGVGRKVSLGARWANNGVVESFATNRTFLSQWPHVPALPRFDGSRFYIALAVYVFPSFLLIIDTSHCLVTLAT